MTSSYTTNKKIEKPANGDYNNTWSVPVNNDWDIIDRAFGGTTALNAVAVSGTVALTTSQYQAPIVVISGALTGNINYQLPAGIGGYWFVFNNTTTPAGGPFAVLFSSAGGGSTVTLAQGVTTAVICDGTNVGRADTNPPAAGGSTTQVQYNSGGLLAGSANLTWNGTTLTSSSFTGPLTGNATTASSVTNAVTFSNTGGAAVGTTFNGSAARTIDYSTVGAPKTDGTGASGTWGISISGNAANVTGTVAVANGGTGQTTYTNGQLLIGNTTGNTLTKSTLTAGTGVTITNGTGTITIAATGTGGTVTSTSVVSANGFAGTVATATTTPAITLTTTITGVLKGNGTAISAATAGTDYVAPGGALGTPSSGTLTNCTFPTLNQNTTGSSGSCTGNSATATTATTATTANALNTANNYQVNSLGVGTAASGTAGEIRATDNVTAFYSSDATLKENVQPIQNALGIVSAVGGKTFDWTDAYIADHGGEDGYFIQKSDFGVIAQDVEEMFPLAVRTRDDGTLAVDYEKLVAVAFAAIAELKAEVDELRQQAVKVIK